MGNRISVAAIAVGLMLCASTNGALGGETQSLDEWIKKPADQQEASYLFVRCAGFFHGLMGYAGSSFDPKVTQQYQMSIISLSFASMEARRSRRGGEVKDYLEEVSHDKNLIAEMYNKRMHQNYAASGQAFSDDAFIKGDWKICKAMDRLAKGKS